MAARPGSIPRVLALAAALLAGLVGCGDPVTQLYVVNADDVGYYVTFYEGLGSGPGSTTATRLPAQGEGLLFSTTGTVSGRIEVRLADCSVAQIVSTTGGRTLISIQAGKATLTGDANLASLPSRTLQSSADCPSS